MRPRVAEIRSIVSILDQEWDDVDELAKTILTEAFDLLLKREWWTIVANDKRLGVFTFGPYETRNKAVKEVGKSIVSPGPEPMAVFYRKLALGNDD